MSLSCAARAAARRRAILSSGGVPAQAGGASGDGVCWRSVVRARLSVIATASSLEPMMSAVSRAVKPSTSRKISTARALGESSCTAVTNASYRNRVRNLSPRNQNQGVKHLPGSHTPQQDHPRLAGQNVSPNALTWETCLGVCLVAFLSATSMTGM